MIKISCYSCGKELAFAQSIGRREECSQCHSDVHVCKNCQYYDAKVYNECKETQADVVREKDRANFCDFFVPHQDGKRDSAADKAAELRAKAEALFKKT